jgi:VCBS repeat-containing protein
VPAERSLLYRRYLPFLAAIVFLTLLAGSDVGITQKAIPAKVGQVLDWSTRHILYPQGASRRALALSERDPRVYWNYLRLIQAASEARDPVGRRRRHRPVRNRPDWSVSLGAAGTAANMYPAKFSFDTNATPSCANDYAVFTINATGSATQANIAAFNNLYPGNTSTTTFAITAATEAGTTVTITISAANFAALAPAVNGTVTVTGMVPAGYNGTYVVTSVGIPAKSFTYEDAAGLGAVTTRGMAAEGGTTCGTNTAPTVNWAYNISGVKLATSPIISLTGTKVAFVDSASPAVFHVLTWTAGQGTVGAPVLGAAQVANLTLTGATTDTNSSPFMNYATDTAYVGTDNGKLFKITPVFNGTPALAGAPWPITVAAGVTLTGPVLDFSTAAGGNIFVGGSDGNLYGYIVSTGAALVGSPNLIGGISPFGGVTDPPIVDVVNNLLYASTGDRTGSPNIAAVVQLPTSMLTGGVALNIGPGGVANIHSVAFNDGYLTSGIFSNWLLYACGMFPPGTTPGLWQAGFNAARTIISKTPLFQLSTNSGEPCSPLTEFKNNSVDQLFLGLPTAGKVASVNITAASPGATTATATATGGTSGIIVDNVGTLGQESSIYFSTLATGTCATSTIHAAATGATEIGTTVTITTTTAHGFGVGESVTIAGVGVAGYNGTFVVTAVASATTFTYTAASGLAASGGGTATASGFCAVKLTQGALL